MDSARVNPIKFQLQVEQVIATKRQEIRKRGSVCAARLIKLSLQEFREESFLRKLLVTFDCRREFLPTYTLRDCLITA